MKLIAGLGNPGKVYKNSRHNMGFEVIDRLAKKWIISVSARRLRSKTGSGRIAGEQVILAKPVTFMNLSGQAVRALVTYYRLDIKNILIVCDDVNLRPGLIRIRPDGRHGGHNGLLSIIDELGTPGFARLRIGVDNANSEAALAKYVLSAPDESQRPLLEESLNQAVKAVEIWVTQGTLEAMNRFNKR